MSSSSPPTPRSQIEQFLREQKTSKPVKRQLKRRSSSSSSRRQSLNNSTLRKQAVLSSANRTEHSVSLNDGLTPRSQIHNFLTAAQTGVPVARKKQHTRQDGPLGESPFERPGPFTSSVLDTTEDTPRTTISNILGSTATGITGARVNHYQNIPRSPSTQSKKENVSLQQSSIRSPNSDSLLNITLPKAGPSNFGHVPSIKPSASNIAEALSQATTTSVNVSTIYTGSQPPSEVGSLTHIPETPLEEEEGIVEGKSVEEEVEEENVQEEFEEENVNEEFEGESVDEEVEEESEVESEEDGETEEEMVDGETPQNASEPDNPEMEDMDQSEHVSNSSSGASEEASAVPDISAFHMSTTNRPAIINQSVQNHSESVSMQDQSDSTLNKTRRCELIVPSEIPIKPRVQVQINFPVMGKQVSTGTISPAQRKRKPSGLTHSRQLRGGDKQKDVKKALSLPRSLTKSIFCHFSKCKNITSGALDAVEKVSEQFWSQFTTDVVAFADHAGRLSITEQDVELLMRRQGFVTESQSMYTLVEKYLPLEYREKIIPMAVSGNKVIPPK